MVSTKERQRIEATFASMQTRMERQHQALTRLVALNSLACGALLEIAAWSEGPQDTSPAQIATEALERIKAMTEDAAAETIDGEESTTQQSPTTDEEKQ